MALQSVSPDSGPPVIGPIDSAFRTAVQLLEARRASLLVRDVLEPVLTMAASVGIEDSVMDMVRIPVGKGIAGVVAARNIALFGEFEDGTFLSTPVVTERGVEGVLNVTNRVGGRRYGADQIKLAMSAAAHIGNLIQYERTALRDPVSGLPNRRAFEDVLARELALGQRTGRVFSLAFLDLDNLKTINDDFGHTRGDEVIRGVGTCLQRVLRPYDVAGRLGGDEFAILISGTGETDGDIASRISAAMAHLTHELNMPISTSMGVARYPADADTGAELIAIADARMYEQKRKKKRVKAPDRLPPYPSDS